MQSMQPLPPAIRRPLRNSAEVERELEIERTALEIADLAAREATLASEQGRIGEELNAVRAAKAERIRRLAAGGSGSNGSAPSSAPLRKQQEAPSERVFDLKERIYRFLADNPKMVVGIAVLTHVLGIGRSTASVYLSELAKEGRIRRLELGKYQALDGAAQPVTIAATILPQANATDAALPAKILALLSSKSSETFDAPGIATCFGLTGETNVNSIRGALSRLYRAGKLFKVGRGDYTANPSAEGATKFEGAHGESALSP